MSQRLSWAPSRSPGASGPLHRDPRQPRPLCPGSRCDGTPPTRGVRIAPADAGWPRGVGVCIGPGDPGGQNGPSAVPVPKKVAAVTGLLLEASHQPVALFQLPAHVAISYQRSKPGGKLPRRWPGAPAAPATLERRRRDRWTRFYASAQPRAPVLLPHRCSSDANSAGSRLVTLPGCRRSRSHGP